MFSVRSAVALRQAQNFARTEITEGFFIHRKAAKNAELFFMPILEIENRHKTLNPSGIIPIQTGIRDKPFAEC